MQGVGFRPFVYTLAKRHKLKGTVLNGSQGVVIAVNCTEETLNNFISDIKNELPPLAIIESLEYSIVEEQNFPEFSIIETEEEGERTVRVPADVSVCDACKDELFDPNNRRNSYPFITCTHCGVRYSIIYDLPYDRKNTSMKFFPMCKSCLDEYTNPLNRRYHAQPIGCWECGPQMSLIVNNKPLKLEQRAMLSKVSEYILAGKIVAVKGVGGYHLMCDASNPIAVNKLRERKRRPTKPFAVMVKDLDMAQKYAKISKEEETLLSSKERPIVILKMRKDKVLENVAPNISKIGLFLPYTPLHLLLLEEVDRPLVATSANITDEPICTNLEEIEKLSEVYDLLLDHEREIVNGCDDSVMMVVSGKNITLRRARGFAPVSLTLPFFLPRHKLAMGPNQKSTVAIGFENQVILSPHIGDLDSIGSVNYYRQNIETFMRMYDFSVEELVYDKHPLYESSKVAQEYLDKDKSLLGKGVQHHYAHILSVMAENSYFEKVLGVAFDGTGYGDDARLWGGEFLLCRREGYERVAHISYFKLLGGSKAIKEPKRVALSLLFDIYGEEALSLKNKTTSEFSAFELKSYYIAWQKGLNAPLSSSVGRLFDAVASLTGICQVMSFEGESGMLLEEYYLPEVKDFYDFSLTDGIIDILPVIKAVSEESDAHIAVSKFFNTLVEIVLHVSAQYNLPLALSGGVFQNSVLLKLLLEKREELLLPCNFPPNDGGIALGQMLAL